MGSGRAIRKASRAHRIALRRSISPEEFGNVIDINADGEGGGWHQRFVAVCCQHYPTRPYSSPPSGG